MRSVLFVSATRRTAKPAWKKYRFPSISKTVLVFVGNINIYNWNVFKLSPLSSMCCAFQVISDIVAIMEETVLNIGTRESVKVHLYEFFIFPVLSLPILFLQQKAFILRFHFLCMYFFICYLICTLIPSSICICIFLHGLHEKVHIFTYATISALWYLGKW